MKTDEVVVGAEVVAAAVAAVQAGRPVVFRGPLGAGKTWALRQAAQALRAHEQPVEWVTGSVSAATLRFGALLGLLPAGEHDPGRLLDALLAGLQHRAQDRRAGDRRANSRPGGDRRTRQRRAVLVVDDAHLLDAGSAALVHHLARSGTLQLLLAVEDQAAVPDAISGLWHDDMALLVPVPPFTREQVGRWWLQEYGQAPDEAMTEQLHQRTAGLPLLLQQVARSAVASDAVRLQLGQWRLRAPLPPVGNAPLEAVSSRLARLPATVRRAAEAVAVGTPLPLHCAIRLIPAEDLDQAESAGLINHRQDSRRRLIEVAHPAYAEVLLAELGPTRRRTLTAAIADQLARDGQHRHGDLLRQVQLAQTDCTLGDCPQRLLTAAAEARALGDYALGGRLADLAVAAGAGPEAEQVAVEMRLWQRYVDDVDPLLLDALHDAESPQAPLPTRLGQAAMLFFGHRRLDAAAAALRALHPKAEAAGGQLHEQVAALSAAVALNRGRVRDALPAVTLVRDQADPVSPALLAVAMSALTWTGQPAEALRLGEQVTVDHDVTGPPLVTAVLEAVRCTALGHSGALVQAAGHADQAYQQAVRGGPEDLRAVWAVCRGHLALLQGRLEHANASFSDAAAIAERLPTVLGPGAVVMCWAGIAETAAWLRELPQAEQALADAQQRALPGALHPEIEFAQIRVLARIGAHTQARLVAAALADVSLRTGQVLHAGRALYDIARLGDAGSVAGRLDQLADEHDAALLTAWATAARAYADADPAALLSSAHLLTDVGLLLHGAELAAAAAVGFADLGSKALVGQAQRLSEQLHHRCGNPPSLVLAQHRLPLTRREHEVAALVATGRTSRAVAQQLHLSVRTVENHLHAAFTKLGVRTREDLAAILHAAARSTQVAQTG